MAGFAAILLIVALMSPGTSHVERRKTPLLSDVMNWSRNARPSTLEVLLLAFIGILL
jgi:hypothetical protein